MRKFNGLLRYSQGTATDGFSATALAYANNWNASDQVALRAITTGQIGLFGEIDPTDGGDTSRFMLSTRFAQSDDDGLWKANAYVVKYHAQSLQQLHVVHDQSDLGRSIPSVR